jgi:hypothetical protein
LISTEYNFSAGQKIKYKNLLLLDDNTWLIKTRNINSTNNSDPQSCDLGAQCVCKIVPYFKETNSDYYT